jgi:hypothetical protein
VRELKRNKVTKKKESEDMDLSRFENASPTERAQLAKLFQRAAELAAPTKNEREPNK